MMIVGFIFYFLIWYLPNFLNTDFSGTTAAIIICIWLKQVNINTRTRNVSVPQNQEVDLKNWGMSGFSPCLLHGSFLFVWRCSAKFICFSHPSINRHQLYKPRGCVCHPCQAYFLSGLPRNEVSSKCMLPMSRDPNSPHYSPLPMAWWYPEALEMLTASHQPFWCRV